MKPEFMNVKLQITTGKRHYAVVAGVFILLAMLVSGCKANASDLAQRYAVGSIWQVPDLDEDGTLEWDAASLVAQEQYAGLSEASRTLDGLNLTEVVFGEGNRQADVQVAIRDMVEEVEGQQTPELPVVALLGATSNEASMRAAAVANFFNIPMVVPTANGDSLFPSNNLWAFQLSAPGSAYAEFVFGTVLADLKASDMLEDNKLIENLKIAVLYEANTFGESAAVATAEAAMAESVGIAVYEKFPAVRPDTARLKELAADLLLHEVDLVYMVSSEPGVALSLVQQIKDEYADQPLPILVGQAGGFASTDFLNSSDAQGVYVIRQKLEAESCPLAVDSFNEVQTYAAAYLLERAVGLAVERQASILTSGLSLNISTISQTVLMRESIRDALKEFNEQVPCMGQVSFENNGQLKSPQFEVLLVRKGEVCFCLTALFLEAIADQLTE